MEAQTRNGLLNAPASQTDYNLRQFLGERFAPSLVLFAEYQEAKADPGKDYHPRDIRLFLASASGRLVPGEGNLFEKIMPSFPRFFFVVLAIVSALAIWFVTKTPTWIGNLPQSTTIDVARLVWLGVFALLVGTLGLICFTYLLVMAYSLPKWWILMLPVIYAISFAGLLAIDTPTIGGIVLGSWFAVAALFAGGLRVVNEKFGFRDPPMPGAVFEELTSSFDETMALRFVQCGPPGDADLHRSRYLRLRSKWGDLSSTIAYANTTFGQELDDKTPGAYTEYTDLVAVQYWLAYFYNDWENRHEMDWEHVTVYAWLPPGGNLIDRATKSVPIACAFSAHEGGYIARKDPITAEMEWDGNHPIVYVAHGSHANYPRPGKYKPTFTLGGLRFGGREASMFRRSRYGYTDVTPPRSQDFAPLAIIAIPRPSENGAWKHICSEEGYSDAGCQAKSYAAAHPPVPAEPTPWLLFLPPFWPMWVVLGIISALQPQVPAEMRDPRAICQRDFRWLNLNGRWGYSGSLFGGDASPDSPTKQASWHPFDWLSQYELNRPAAGVQVLRQARINAVNDWQVAAELPTAVPY